MTSVMKGGAKRPAAGPAAGGKDRNCGNRPGYFLVAGSAATNWDWKKGEHTRGNIIFGNHLVYDATMQRRGIVPQRIAVYANGKIALSKDVVTRLA